MDIIRIAIQKTGRLRKKSVQLLQDSGIDIANETDRLKTVAKNFPLEVLYIRDDDIPHYVEQKVADMGVLGENELLEQDRQVEVITTLGFAKCRLSLAIPSKEKYTGIAFFNKKKIATSYPHLLASFLKKRDIHAAIERISGSVELAPSIGLADAICDIVSTGSTLLENSLQEVEVVLKSQAVLIASKGLSNEKQDICHKLLFRISAVQRAATNKYILLNAPNSALEAISKLIPGIKSPTVLPLKEKGWSSLHSTVQEDDFWNIAEQLKKLGATGILVVPVEKMLI